MKRESGLIRLAHLTTILCLMVGTSFAQNYSLSFDGDGDYIEIQDADILSPASYTIELWVKQPTLTSGRNTYVYKYDGSNHVEYNFMENPPGGDEGIYAYAGSQYFASGSHPTADTWTHIAVTFDTDIDSMEIFVGGTSSGKQHITTGVSNTNGKLYIGHFVSGSSYNALTGIIDEVRISDNIRYTSNFTVATTEFITDANTVALYHFNEGAGSAVNDASGHGNHGTIYNATWSSDAPDLTQNYALDFDGVDDYVSVPDLGQLSAFTFEMWVKLEGSVDEYRGLFGTQGWGSGRVHWEITTNNKWECGIDDGSTYGVTGSYVFDETVQNSWLHLAASYESGGTVKLFVNGVLDAQENTSQVVNLTELRIGDVFTQARYFDGVIDEVRISDIDRYTANFSPSLNLNADANTLILYHFNEGSGNTVNDASGNGNHGTINGASWTTMIPSYSHSSWQVKIKAQNENDVSDNSNYLGVSSSATSGFDASFDEVEPPVPVGDYLSVYFPHPDWNNTLGDNFTKDIRDSVDISDLMQVWDFEVKSSTSEQTTLTFLYTDVPSVPVILENLATGERETLSGNGTYSFTTVADSAHAFRISIGDTVTPQLTLGASCSGARILQADSTFALDWTSSDGNGVDSVFVWFSPDSGATYSSVASLGNTSTYDWQVPDYDLNHKCMIKVTAQDYAGNSVTGTSNHLITIAGDSLVASVLAGWSLWGAPVIPTADSMETNLNDDFSDYWVTYGYADKGYSFADLLTITEGCWLGTLADATIDVLGTPVTSNQTIDLPVGWDLVSNPLVLDVAVDSLQFVKDGSVKSKTEAVEAGWINTIYGYGAPGYSEAATLEPWKGYWISVLENDVSMTFPIHRQTSQTLGKTSVTDWQITFHTSAENSEDHSTIIGIKPEATDAFDNRIDIVKPPLPPDGVHFTSLSVRHPEWNHPLGDRFSVDFRGDIPLHDSKEWKLQAESSASEVDLSWTIENLPDNIQVGIDLTGDGNFEDMRTISPVKVNANANLSVRLLNTILSVDGESALPTEYAVQQNYPNPFNPETTIAYQLPKTGHVEISIYNIMGKLVRTLVAEHQEAGFHKVTLDGSGLSSGVYYYRISAGEFVKVKKAILLK